MNFLNSHKAIMILLLSMIGIVENTFVKSEAVEHQSAKFKNYSFQKSDNQNTPIFLIADMAEVDRGEEEAHTYSEFTSTISYLNTFSIDFLIVKKLTLNHAKSAQFIPKQKRNILYCTFII